MDFTEKYITHITECDRHFFRQEYKEAFQVLGVLRTVIDKEVETELDNDFNSRAALCALLYGQCEEALRLTEMVNLNSPGFLLIQALRGWALKEIGYEKRANVLFHYVLNSIPDTDSVMDCLGAAISSRLLANEVSYFFFEFAIEKFVSLTGNDKKLNLLWATFSFLRKSELEKTVEGKQDCLMKALALTKDSSAIYDYLGSTYYSQRKYELALKCYLKSIEIFPFSNYYRHIKVGFLYFYLGLEEEAKRFILYFLAYSRDLHIFYWIIRPSIEIRKSNELSDFEKNYKIGLLLYYSQVYQSSYIMLEKAKESDKYNYKLCIFMCIVQRYLGLLSEAIDNIEDLRQNKFPNDIPLMIILAELYTVSSKYEKAEELYQNIIEITPGKSFSIYLYVKFLNKQNRLEDSLKQIVAALEIDPKKIKLLIMKALIHSSLKQLKEAYDTYEEVLSINPNLQSTKYQLSQINYVLNKYQKSFDQMMNIKEGEVGYEKSISLMVKLFITHPSELTKEQLEYANSKLRDKVSMHLKTLGDPPKPKKKATKKSSFKTDESKTELKQMKIEGKEENNEVQQIKIDPKNSKNKKPSIEKINVSKSKNSMKIIVEKKGKNNKSSSKKSVKRKYQNQINDEEDISMENEETKDNVNMKEEYDDEDDYDEEEEEIIDENELGNNGIEEEEEEIYSEKDEEEKDNSEREVDEEEEDVEEEENDEQANLDEIEINKLLEGQDETLSDLDVIDMEINESLSSAKPEDQYKEYLQKIKEENIKDKQEIFREYSKYFIDNQHSYTKLLNQTRKMNIQTLFEGNDIEDILIAEIKLNQLDKGLIDDDEEEEEEEENEEQNGEAIHIEENDDNSQNSENSNQEDGEEEIENENQSSAQDDSENEHSINKTNSEDEDAEEKDQSEEIEDDEIIIESQEEENEDEDVDDDVNEEDKKISSIKLGRMMAVNNPRLRKIKKISKVIKKCKSTSSLAKSKRKNNSKNKNVPKSKLNLQRKKSEESPVKKTKEQSKQQQIRGEIKRKQQMNKKQEKLKKVSVNDKKSEKQRSFSSENEIQSRQTRSQSATSSKKETPNNVRNKSSLVRSKKLKQTKLMSKKEKKNVLKSKQNNQDSSSQNKTRNKTNKGDKESKKEVKQAVLKKKIKKQIKKKPKKEIKLLQTPEKKIKSKSTK